MCVKRQLTTLVIAILGSASMLACPAEEVDQYPYRVICRGMNIDFSRDTPPPPREMELTVHSTLPTVTLSDIRFTLKGPDESHDIAVSPSGSCRLPVSKALFDADAVLVSNQPKGTVGFESSVSHSLDLATAECGPHIIDGRIDYEKLATLATEARERARKKLEEKNGGEYLLAKPDATDGLWYIVLRVSQDADSAKAEIVEETPGADVGPVRQAFRKLVKKPSPSIQVAPGVFLLPYSDALRKRNPVISLSKNPSWTCVIVEKPNGPK